MSPDSLDPRFIGRLLTATALLGATLVPLPAAAQQCGSTPRPPECTAYRRVDTRIGDYGVSGTIFDLGPGQGFQTELVARKQRPGGHGEYVPPDPGWHRGDGPSGADVLRVYCRRDDYAFLPPQAVGGLPCDRPTSSSARDPRQVALGMWDQLPLPQLTLGMNPQLGLVAVPTWFWVDGYAGASLPLVDTLLLPRAECRRVVDRDGRGDVVLDGQGHPSSHQACRTLYDSLTVEVVAWPTQYVWDFGDRQSLPIVCRGLGACPAGLGRPYTDPRSPSPIAHAYQWTSLGQNGEQDAYTVQLQIRFGAHYRFSRNGQAMTSWEPLPDRLLTASASHRVQEAQAVLTPP